MVVFFSFFFLLNISQAFFEGMATGSQLAEGDYGRALGHVGWFPSPASQLTWSRSFSNSFFIKKIKKCSNYQFYKAYKISKRETQAQGAEV